MKRLKENFDNLNKITKLDFFELTKTKKKEYEYNYKINDTSSFGFSFNNIKEEDLEKVLITVTYKENEFFIEKTFNFIEFKTKFKEFIKTLTILKNVSSINNESIIETLKTIFNLNKENNSMENQAKKHIDEIKLTIKPKKANLSKLRKNFISKKEAYEKSKKKS